jgi:hypothetical protein
MIGANRAIQGDSDWRTGIAIRHCLESWLMFFIGNGGILLIIYNLRYNYTIGIASKPIDCIYLPW